MQSFLVLVLSALVSWAGASLAVSAGFDPHTAIAGILPLPLLVVAALRLEAFGPSRALPPHRREDLRVQLPLALLIVAAALLLRLYTLLDRPVWSDELWTLRNLLGGTWGTILRISLDDYWPPLHYFVLGVATRIGDIGVLSLRLPSVLFGTAAVAAMIPLGTKLLGSRRVGLAAAALLAGANLHVLHSQEARVYAFLVLMAVVAASYFYPAFWQGRVSWAYIAAATALTYSHSFASWFFIWALMAYALATAFWWDRRDLLKPAVTTHLIIFGLMLPLGAAMAYVRFVRGLEVPLWWATGLSDERSLFVTTLFQIAALSARSGAAFMFQVVMAGLVLFSVFRRPSRRPPGTGKGPEEDEPGSDADRHVITFLLFWILFPLLVSFVISIATRLDTWGSSRYHLTVLPGICLLVATGFQFIRTRTARALGAILLVLIPAKDLPDYYLNFDHPALDEAADLVRVTGTVDERIYVAQALRAFAYYYRDAYPRIGSLEWDRFAASYAGLDTLTADYTGRYASRYDVEKIPARIRHMVAVAGDRTAHGRTPLWYDDYIREEQARGGFRPPYWVVLYSPGELEILDTLRSAGVECGIESRTEFRNVLVLHCEPLRAPPSSGAAGDSGLANSLRSRPPGGSPLALDRPGRVPPVEAEVRSSS